MSTFMLETGAWQPDGTCSEQGGQHSTFGASRNRYSNTQEKKCVWTLG